MKGQTMGLHWNALGVCLILTVAVLQGTPGWATALTNQDTEKLTATCNAMFEHHGNASDFTRRYCDCMSKELRTRMTMEEMVAFNKQRAMGGDPGKEYWNTMAQAAKSCKP